MRPANGMKFVMAISTLDCTGCGACVKSCLGNKKPDNQALVMKPIDSQRPMQEVFDYAITTSDKPEVATDATVKSTQFKQPLLEFSGACAGCGETPYAKLVTQLYGDRMFIANATGCSSIWGGSAPATPYTVNKKGFGPAWHNSLFEDNAEFGLGMALGQQAIQDRLVGYVDQISEMTSDEALKTAIADYKATLTDSGKSRVATDALISALEATSAEGELKETIDKTLAEKDSLAKKSMWIFGGDGWAYDIGYGGLDHVIASGKNVNIVVFDTDRKSVV